MTYHNVPPRSWIWNDRVGTNNLELDAIAAYHLDETVVLDSPLLHEIGEGRRAGPGFIGEHRLMTTVSQFLVGDRDDSVE